MQQKILGQGVIAGILGASVLALWFMILDGLRGEPLMTPSVLGTLVFRGELPPDRIDPLAVAGYTVIHYTLFVALGLAGAWVAGRIEERPRLILAVLILFTVMQAFALSFTTVLAETLEGAIQWWAAVLGNLFAVAAMVAYLWRRHRRARRVLDDRKVFDSRQ
jgi:hypothetical protein